MLRPVEHRAPLAQDELRVVRSGVEWQQLRHLVAPGPAVDVAEECAAGIGGIRDVVAPREARHQPAVDGARGGPGGNGDFSERPVLILDQFEDLFKLPSNRDDLWDTLAGLVNVHDAPVQRLLR